MATLSIVIPDELASGSRQAASKLGISRAKFIRQAIMHELEALRIKLEVQQLQQCYQAMKTSPAYLQEAQEIMEGLSAPLPDEKEEWWTGK